MLANGGWDLIGAPTNASKWRMGFNSVFKGLILARALTNIRQPGSRPKKKKNSCISVRREDKMSVFFFRDAKRTLLWGDHKSPCGAERNKRRSHCTETE